METTKPNNEALNEGAKVIEKLFNDSNSALMNIYKKQMDLTAGFYNNLFNSSIGNTNGFVHNSSTPKMFANMDMAQWFTNPFANFSATNLQNPFLTSIEKIMEFNQKLLSPFTNGIQNKGTNPESMNEEYKKLLEVRLKDSKEMLNTVAETFNKQLESSVETNKKTMEEISNQFSLAMKQNQKLLTDMLNTQQILPVTNEKKENEASLNASITPSSGTASVKK